jgi:hypothetical protein
MAENTQGKNGPANMPAFRAQGQKRMPKNRRKFSSRTEKPQTHSGQANKHEKAQLQIANRVCNPYRL